MRRADGDSAHHRQRVLPFFPSPVPIDRHPRPSARWQRLHAQGTAIHPRLPNTRNFKECLHEFVAGILTIIKKGDKSAEAQLPACLQM
jgi:hypothetical protein